MSRRSFRRSPARLKGGLGLTALAGVTVLTLAACGSGSSSSSSSSATGTSTGSSSNVGSTTSGSIVWEASPLSGTGANDARTVLINAFEKQYPNIKVTLVSAPTDTDTYRATVATQISGGASSPDVFMGDVIWPAQFGAHQLAVPLSKYLPASYWTKFAPGLVAGATYKGLVYGSPLFEDQGFLYYRKDLLAKYHMAVPQTWEQLETDAKTLASNGSVKYGFVWQGDSYEGLTCNFMEYLTSAGGSPTNAAYTSATLNSPAALKAVTFMRSLITSGASPAAVTTFQEPQAMNTFGAGNAAFLRNWDYAYTCRHYSVQRRQAHREPGRRGAAADLRGPGVPRLLQHRRLEPVHQPAQRSPGRGPDVHPVDVGHHGAEHPVPEVRVHLHRPGRAHLARDHRLQPGVCRRAEDQAGPAARGHARVPGAVHRDLPERERGPGRVGLSVGGGGGHAVRRDHRTIQYVQRRVVTHPPCCLGREAIRFPAPGGRLGRRLAAPRYLSRLYLSRPPAARSYP